MAKVKAKTHAVIDGNPVGTVIDVEEHDFVWLCDLGYVEKIEDVKSADTSKKPTQAKRKPRAKKEVTEDK